MDSEQNFSWTMMFFVSGFSFMGFSFLTKFLDGNHSQLLLMVGVAATGAGIWCWVLKSLIQYSASNKKKKTIVP